jgi:hypothetical protein
MPLVGLKIPAGVVRHGTDYENSGRWRDANLIRWENNSVRPIGGWEERSIYIPATKTVTSITIDTSGLPVFFTLVTSTAHGVTAGNNFKLSGAGTGSVSGNDINSDEVYCFEVVNTTTLKFYNPNVQSSAFDSSDTFNASGAVLDNKQGASTITNPPRGALAWTDNQFNPNLAIGNYEKLFHVSGVNVITDITPAGFTTGRANADPNNGYGGYYYGLSNYGTQRPDNAIGLEADTWALDNWGQYLVACATSDKKIYEWQLSTSAVAQQISNSPLARSIVVTEDRFLFALASDNDPRKISWCDRDDNTVWTPSATNEAGDYTINSQGEILQGINVRGRTLILTTVDAFVATYSGAPVVYGFEQVGKDCGAVSRRSAVALDEGGFWMGNNGFFFYNGSAVQEIPCAVHDYVFEDINTAEISKVWGLHNGQFNEIWWFYPSGSSVEIDRYVIFDYKEKHWNIGQLNRTAGVDIGVFTNPIWLDETGKAYNQERGYDHQNVLPFVESSPISLGEGDNVMNVTKLIPDENNLGDVSVTFKTRYYPTGAETTHGAFTLSNPTSVRLQGRQVRMRINGVNLVNWKVGKMRVEVTTGGKR